MTTQSLALGIDFGTSNSAAGMLRDGKPHLIEVEAGERTLPTAFFFDFDTRKTLIGGAANTALIDGLEGRYMRALKRVLGTSLMHEKRQILNERVTFVDIIARFLKQLKTRAEAETGLVFERVLSGRPVHFHLNDAARDAKAEEDLLACYLAAGFKDVAFMAEPEAAAIASGALDQSKSLGLIVDIGGGTSDFSLFQAQRGGVNILANHGIRIGGTDFDRAVSIDRVMPLLGKGSELRNLHGPGTMTTPNAIFNDLATWEKIPFLYTATSRRTVADMHKMSQEPEKLKRFVDVLESELGHDIAFAVERGKIAANSGTETRAEIDLSIVERGLSAELYPIMLDHLLRSFSDSIQTGALETLAMADCTPARVDRVIYVGGSSLMSFVTNTMKDTFPEAQHEFSEVFTAVADGLAIAAGH